jgi:predicted PurR-regulated permease PerM
MASSFRTYAKRATFTIALSLAGIFALLLLWHGFRLLLVLFAGILFAIFLDAITRLFNRIGPLTRPWAFGLALLALVLATVGTFTLIGAQVSSQLTELGQRLTEAWSTIQAALQQNVLGRWLLGAIPQPGDGADSGGGQAGTIMAVFSGTVGVLSDVAVILIIGIFGAAQAGLYTRGALHLVPSALNDRAKSLLQTLGHALRWWLVGRLASMAIVGVMTTLGLWLIGIPLALSLGLLAGILSFVPYIGPLVSVIPALLVALLEGPQMILYVLVIYVGVQLLESNLITPLVQRRAVSLPPVALLVAQFLLGIAAGLFGVLVATPLAVVIIVLVQVLYVHGVLGDDVTVLGEDR